MVSVKVSLVGRMAFVVHSGPVDEVLAALNEAKLGASLQTSGMEQVELESAGWSMMFPCMLTALWLAGLGLETFHVEFPTSTAFFALSVSLGILPVLQKAIRNLSFGILEINCLMAIAVVGAVALGQLSDAGLVVVLLAWANELESVSMRWVRNALTASSATAAPSSALLKSGQEVQVSSLEVGDIISVRAGEQIPVDGVVETGKITVDESLLTGEVTPVHKSKGIPVLGGTLCTEGYAEVKATAKASSSTLHTIAQMVEEAGASDSPAQMTLDRIVKWYIPSILLLSGLVALVGPLLTGQPLREWVLRSLVVLISACPCALTIAGTIPALAAISRGASHGVLVKSCEKLDRVADVRALAFDKTGTLTEGKFNVSVSAPIASPNHVQWRQDLVMQLVASLEAKSSHPLASSIVSHVLVCVTDAVDTMGLDAGLFPVKNFKATEGLGVSGTVEVAGKPVKVEVGNRALLSQSETVAVQSFRSRHDASTLLFVKLNGELQVAMALSDTVRANARSAVAALHALGLETVVLTGDNEATMKTVMREVGINEGISKCKPVDKLNWIKEQRREGKVCALIGDGINDSPALRAADVGLAMGAGSSALAVSAADVVFMANDLQCIGTLIRLSRHVRVLVKQNVVLAAVVKGFVVVLAFFGFAQLWMAVLADCGSLLLVLANGLRPFYFAFDNHGSLDDDDDDGDRETEPLLGTRIE